MKINTVIKEQQKIKSAVSQYRDTYDQFPGDFDNAFYFWGTDCGADAANCDGNGDGKVDLSGTAADNETNLVFSHLNLANLIKGEYSYSNSEYHSGFSENTALFVLHLSLATFSCCVSDDISLNFLGINDNLNGATQSPTFKPIENYIIDKKLDDGMPWTGDVTIRVVGNIAFSGCTDKSSRDITAIYKISSDEASPRFTIKLACLSDIIAPPFCTPFEPD